MTDNDTPLWKTRPLLESGEWAGWRPIIGADPFEDHVGPFYTRYDSDGPTRLGLLRSLGRRLRLLRGKIGRFSEA